MYLTLSYVWQFWNVFSQETSLSIQLFKKALKNPYSAFVDIIILHYPAKNESVTATPRVAMTKKIVLTIFSFNILQYNITETSSQSSIYEKKSK